MINEPLTDKFERFHEDNPHVYRMFIRLAKHAISRGKKVSAQFIIERIRWEIVMDTYDEDGFKINANFAAFYARMFMKDYPLHGGYFNLRCSIADEWVLGY